MSLRVTIDTLQLYDPDRSKSVANVWISRPSAHEDQAVGRVFVVSHITTPSRLNQEIITILQDEIRTHFMQSTEPLLEAAFEQALTKVNQRLHLLIIEGVNEWVDHANFIVGAFRQQQMVLTVVGDMSGYLLRDRRLQPIFGDHQPTALNPLRVFSTLWPGSIRPDDRLIFATPSLLDYFSLEKLRRTMLDHTPAEAARSLENTLVGIDINIAIAAIILAAEPVEELAVNPARITHQTWSRTAPQVSMEELNNRERQTEQLLSPSVWPAIKDLGQQFGQGLTRFVRTTILRQPPKRIVASGFSRSSQRVGAVHLIWEILQSIGRVIRAIGALLWRIASAFRIPSRTRQRIPPAATSPTFPGPQGFRRSFDRLIQGFQRLPRQRQAMIGVALLLLFIITTAIVQTGSSKTPSPNKKTSADQAAVVRDRIAKAEAALLYGGDDAAKAALKEASAALATIPHKTTKEKAAYTPLFSAVQKLQQQVAHLTVIKNPTVWLDLKKNTPAASPSGLLIWPDAIGVVDRPAAALTRAPKNDPATATVSANTLDTGALIQGAADGTARAVFLTDRGSFVEWNTATKAWKPLDATFPYANPTLVAMDIFQNRIYTIDPPRQAITRFARGGNSLGTGATWLKEPAEFPSAIDLAVNGSIFVLHDNARVTSFVQGRASTFTLESISPAFAKGTSLWTSAESKNIYLTDAQQKRILVFDAQGKLVDQYQSPAWTALKDVVADEKTKTAFVLSGTSIYTVTLLH